MRDYEAGQFQESIVHARGALKLRPDYPEAYNNIAAANASLGRWNEAIAAADMALSLKPDFQLAKNNLDWARSHKEQQH